MGCEAVVLERLRRLLPAPVLGAMETEVINVVDFDSVYDLLYVPLFGTVGAVTAGGQVLRVGIDFAVDYVSGVVSFNPTPEEAVVNPLPCAPVCAAPAPGPGPHASSTLVVCRPAVPLLVAPCPTPGRTPLGQVQVNYEYDLLPDLACRALCQLSEDLPRTWCGAVTVDGVTGLGSIPCNALQVVRLAPQRQCCKRLACRPREGTPDACCQGSDHCQIVICGDQLRVEPPPCITTTYQVELSLGYGCSCAQPCAAACLDDCLLDAVAQKAAALAYGYPGMSQWLTRKDCVGKATTLDGAVLAKAAQGQYTALIFNRAGLRTIRHRGRYREHLGYGQRV